MGFRTVVILSNDTAYEWEQDPELGKKIAKAAYRLHDGGNRKSFDYGSVAQVCHADTQSLMIIDGYLGDEVACKSWHRDEPTDIMKLKLLKEYADSLGMRVVKKSVKKG